MKKNIALGSLLILATGSASAAILPAASLDGSLQDLFGNGIALDTNETGVVNGFGSNDLNNIFLDAVADQNGAEAWNQVDSDTDAYLVSMVEGSGVLGIYSSGNTSLSYTFALSGSNKASFEITDAGALWIESTSTLITGFGDKFGFFYTDSNGTAYTGTSLNVDGSGEYPQTQALSYLLDSGTDVKTDRGVLGEQNQTAEGDDWLIAFETSRNGSDSTDAVFFLEDMEVSAPATLALMGLGLLGLAARRKSKKA